MRPSKPAYFLGLAAFASQRSTCLRAQHGCVIVKDGHVVSTGYNGSIVGQDHCSETGYCERQNRGARPGQNYEWCVAVHSEMNAIVQAARHGTGVKYATMYITGPPCLLCARMIVNSGISKVVFAASDRYEAEASLELLRSSGVEVEEV